ncbi:hypothetical protein [Deinococcus aerophilus]|uniref:Uncharacterized protein n=1 Tax=Deinococcus aerophilus TaxID=522488 RepID=A0ABQ2H1F2_9DEIO|nr:hypothetical protein [Deinococcus aerophilus]GGM22241.1 hypothetical protein GCM10010841_32640 [Deinococcus aerophilus]
MEGERYTEQWISDVPLQPGADKVISDLSLDNAMLKKVVEKRG